MRASQAYEVVQQFELANTDRMQEAINKVEKFLATCDDGDELMDALVGLRQICVGRNLGQKFNEWRVKFMQRSRDEVPTAKEIAFSPCDSHSELVKWLQNELKCSWRILVHRVHGQHVLLLPRVRRAL